MNSLERAGAIWKAFPSAPEERRLRFLRRQFVVATFAAAALLIRLHSLTEDHRGVDTLIGPLGVFVLFAGNRYFRAKQAADDAHRDALVERASRRGDIG